MAILPDPLSVAVPQVQVLDTYPAFERFWRTVRERPIAEQVDRWEHEYMAPWPELRDKLKSSYSDQGVDWRRVARSRIFPNLEERLPRMRRLHRNLIRTLPDSWSRIERILHPDFPVQFVIYVGIGVGAGWATHYGGRRACLFGLENAAELSTGKNGGAPGAVSHEVAHLVHDAWRTSNGLRGVEAPHGSYWRLYVEGFATECERRIDGPQSFGLRTGRRDWLPWCDQHRPWLAAKFLRDVGARRSVRAFFGSWYPLRGQVECGYYLGQQIVRKWAEATSLKSAALLPERVVARRSKLELRAMAGRRS
jgi:hypothetical protein